jgi:O-antigen/teichoic acid export membrane protein
VQLGLIPVGSLISVTHIRFLEHEPGRKRQHLRKSLRYGAMCVAYGLVFALGVEVAGPLLPLVLGDTFEGSVNMTRWIAPLVPLRALASFPLNGLMGLGHTFARTVLLIGSAVFSMILYIALIPHLQWKGAALGTIIGEAALAVAAWSLLFVYEGRHDRAYVVPDAVDELVSDLDLTELETPPIG